MIHKCGISCTEALVIHNIMCNVQLVGCRLIELTNMSLVHGNRFILMENCIGLQFNLKFYSTHTWPNQSHVQPLFQVRLGPTHFTTITCGKMFPFSNKTHRQPNSSLLVLVSITNLRKIMRTQVYLLCNDKIRPIYLSIKVQKVRKRMIMGNLKTLPASPITQKSPFVT